MITAAVEWINGFVWGPGMLAFYLGAGLLLSVRTGFFQVRRFPLAVKTALGGLFGREKQKGGGISPFQALSTALAGTMGVGNIAGVATALTAGGAGAIFWMWASALLGMMTKFAEAALAVRYRAETPKGSSGGPMRYIRYGLGSRTLAAVYAALCLLACFGVGSMTPSGEVAAAFAGFGVPRWLTGAVTGALCLAVILGGIKRIGQLSEKLIPSLSALYILFALAAITLNIRELPGALGDIFRGAFTLRAAGGGAAGYGIARAMRYGLARGVYTNEAGLGSSAIAHAASAERDPVKQGLLGVFEVFLDTFVVTTLTALVILTSQVSGADGAVLAGRAFSASFGGFGTVFVAASMFCFALPSMFGWSYYGEQSLAWLLPEGRAGRAAIIAFRLAFSAAAALGAVMEPGMVWAAADAFNGLMAIPNLMAVVWLSGEVSRLVKGAQTKKRRSKRPCSAGGEKAHTSFISSMKPMSIMRKPKLKTEKARI